MAGTVLPLMVLCTVFIINYASARPQDFLSDDQDPGTQPIFYLPSMNNENFNTPGVTPKGCFHFFVSRNMSSLLADATKMLRTIRDRREREWILTFIYRIKSLAEHLRSHPESRNYNCLPTDDESKKRIFSNDVRGPQQPELYFVDDVIKRSSESEVRQEEKDNQESGKSSVEESAAGIPPNQESLGFSKDLSNSSPEPQSESAASHQSASSTEENPSKPTQEQRDIVLDKKQDILSQNQEVTQASERKQDHSLIDNRDNAIVFSQAYDCNELIKCEEKRDPPQQESSDKYFSDSGDMFLKYLPENASPEDIEHYEHERLKRKLRKVLVEELVPELKKLKTVGGTPSDLMKMWNSINIAEAKQMEEADFDYEETGAAAGDLNMNERSQPERTVAPSLDEVHYSNHVKDHSYEPYDDSDGLVQQLFDVRFDDEPSKTTKSLNDHNNNNDYLITSTHIPPY